MPSPILEAVHPHVQLERRSNSHVGSCPFCQGVSAFHVNADRGFFFCFGCQAGGNADTFRRLLSASTEQPLTLGAACQPSHPCSAASSSPASCQASVG